LIATLTASPFDRWLPFQRLALEQLEPLRVAPGYNLVLHPVPLARTTLRAGEAQEHRVYFPAGGLLVQITWFLEGAGDGLVFQIQDRLTDGYIFSEPLQIMTGAVVPGFTPPSGQIPPYVLRLSTPYAVHPRGELAVTIDNRSAAAREIGLGLWTMEPATP